MKFEFSPLLERVDVAGQKRYKNEKTYHRDVYWEDWFDDACRNIINSINLSERSSLSLHAWRYLDGEDDKRNHQVDFSDFASAVMRIRNNIETTVFECTVVYDTVIKCVARTTLNDEDDIAIVFADGIIKTFWTNSKSDAHKTLNKRKYQTDASVYNRGMKEAYFSKDVYDRKREYAYNVSRSSAEILEEDTDMDEDDIQTIVQLSHARHEMHTSPIRDFSCMDSLGTEYDGGLIQKVNDINDQYNLVSHNIPVPSIPDSVLELEGDMDWEYLCDYFGLPEDTDNDKIYDMVCGEWQDVKDKTSDNIRKWFKELNKKYGTDFPD